MTDAACMGLAYLPSLKLTAVCPWNMGGWEDEISFLEWHIFRG